MFNAFCGVPFNGSGFNGFNGFFNGSTPPFNGFPNAYSNPFAAQGANGFAGGIGQPWFGQNSFAQNWYPQPVFNQFGFNQPGFARTPYTQPSFNTPWNAPVNTVPAFDWNAFAAGCAYGCSSTVSSITGSQTWNTGNTPNSTGVTGNTPMNPFGFVYPFGFTGSNTTPVNGQQAA